jgi:adenosylmethionine-8-amino-7-oxononanoate aminotransferase
MSVCDPETGMHHLFRGALAEQVFAERPACRFEEPCEPRHTRDLESKLEAHAGSLAAVILEPIVQGAGGMWFYSPGYLKRVRELCDEHDVLLIHDEIATGFGRTGRLFASEHADVAPDVLCLGKALTGGVMTLAATLASERICRAIADSSAGALMHGPTFMGNALACSAALASLDLLEREPWQERVSRIEAQLVRELAPCAELPAVADVRVLGAIGVVELHDPVDMKAIQPAFVDAGVWIRPFGRLVYTMPPYVIEGEDLARVTGAMRDVISRLA